MTILDTAAITNITIPTAEIEKFCLKILWQTTQEDLPDLIDELKKLPEIKL